MEESVRDDAAHLKSLRMAAGLDIAELAAKANLSAGQVRQLEEGGESLFYSPQIKNQSLRRVIRMLETPAESPAEDRHASDREARKSQNVIDDIIRLSEQNLKSHVVTSAVKRPGRTQAKLLYVGAALILLALLAWQFNRQPSQELYTEWVEPMTAKVLPEPAVVEDTKAPTVPEVSAPVEAAPVATLPVEAVPVVEAPTPNDCSKINTEPKTVSTAIHNKAGTYVHLYSNKAIQVCVDDGQKKHTLVTLVPGVGKSVHGTAPWTVASNDMKSLQIYFQGGKVLLPPDAGARIYLKEQAVSP